MDRVAGLGSTRQQCAFERSGGRGLHDMRSISERPTMQKPVTNSSQCRTLQRQRGSTLKSLSLAHGLCVQSSTFIRRMPASRKTTSRYLRRWSQPPPSAANIGYAPLWLSALLATRPILGYAPVSSWLRAPLGLVPYYGFAPPIMALRPCYGSAPLVVALRP